MAKKKSGLGKQVLFDQTGTEPTPSSKPKPVSHKTTKPKEDKTKATFYLPVSLINMLDDQWVDLRNLFPRDKRKHVNKSIILEAALRVALVDFQEKGIKSDLYYQVLGSLSADEAE